MNASNNAQGQVRDAKFSMVNTNYLILAFNLFLPMLAIISLAITLIKQGEAKGSWLESHYQWQMKTSAVYIGALALGLLTFHYVIGLGLTGAAIIWSLYRLIRGWTALYRGETLPDEWV